MDRTKLWELVEIHRQDLVTFAQRLVQTQSLPGQEAQVAALIQAEMESLGYDRVWLDEVGNVVGQLEGGPAASLMFNGHMDHVHAGESGQWLYPPFEGEIHDGALWGRGAADMKGALAAMIYAGGLVKKLNRPLRGDLYVSATVQEEVGGLGARHLARTLPVARVIVGEASDNQLRRGHRGRVELCVCFHGRSVHASMPELGINPHFSMGRFVAGLQAMEMACDSDYGVSTVAPTRVLSAPESGNVTPSDLSLTLDWRNVPGENPDEIVAKLGELLEDSLGAGCQGRVEIAMKDLVTHTGSEMEYADTFPSFTTPEEHPWLTEARTALEAALGRGVEVGIWPFATDGGHFAAAGATVLGFGPGDDSVVHTVEERLPVDQMVESVVGYIALSLL